MPYIKDLTQILTSHGRLSIFSLACSILPETPDAVLCEHTDIFWLHLKLCYKEKSSCTKDELLQEVL